MGLTEDLSVLLARLIDEAVESRLNDIEPAIKKSIDDAKALEAVKAYVNLTKGSQLTRPQFDALPVGVREKVPKSKHPDYIRPGIYALSAVRPSEFADVLAAIEIAYRDGPTLHRNRIMIELCYYGALRISSVRRVYVRDLRLDDCEILLPAQSQKNRRGHSVPLPDDLCWRLGVFTGGMTPGDYVFQPDRAHSEAALHREGWQTKGYISAGAADKIIQKLKICLVKKPLYWTQDRLDRFGWHSFRKGMASLIEQSLGLNAAREMLDHRDAKTTLRYLASRRDDIKRIQESAIKAVNREIFEIVDQNA